MITIKFIIGSSIKTNRYYTKFTPFCLMMTNDCQTFDDLI